MPYDPHTERIDAAEQIDLPPGARGISIDHDGESYVVQYLAPTDAGMTPDQACERIREGIASLSSSDPEATAETRRELALSYSEPET